MDEDIVTPPEDEEEMPKENIDSILLTTKKLLGIMPEYTEFDMDVIVNINSSITTLWQLGVGRDGFYITGDEDTYEDLLGEDTSMLQNVKMFIYLKSKLGFDPPSTSATIETTKQMLEELTWRITIQKDEIDRRKNKIDFSK